MRLDTTMHKYETFVALSSKSLEDTYLLFQVVMNDLDKVKVQFDVGYGITSF